MEEENKLGSSSLVASQNANRIHEDEGDDEDEKGSAHGSAFGGEDRNQSQPVAEFLYQLTKMLTDDNSEIIEWTEGRIKVHHPSRLEDEVLHKYFRHSKFASFQRQLNYFGFRKIAGKGKMSPCSYVNESATSDIRSLLLIKRKTNGSAARKAALQQQAAAAMVSQASSVGNPYASLVELAGLQRGLSGALGSSGMLSNSQALSNAMALLSENALRAGIPGLQQQLQQNNSGNHLNLLALQAQQQQLQKQLLEQQQHNGMLQLKSDGTADMQKTNNTVSFAANVKQVDQQNNSTPSLEQLHAHLKALQEQQQQLKQNHQFQNGSNPATAALLAASSQQLQLNRATAALNAFGGGNSMPATAAMEHAAPSAANLFESAANLKSLLEEHAAQSKSAEAQAAAQFLRSQANFGGAAGFPVESSMSFGNLLGSSNRLSSLLSLNSFLGSASREASLVDIAAFRDQLAAAQSAANLGDIASKLRAQNNNNN